jgi:hypothetical protein
LLRYEHAVFALPALEKLQNTLKSSAPAKKAAAEPRRKRNATEVA